MSATATGFELAQIYCIIRITISTQFKYNLSFDRTGSPFYQRSTEQLRIIDMFIEVFIYCLVPLAYSISPESSSQPTTQPELLYRITVHCLHLWYSRVFPLKKTHKSINTVIHSYCHCSYHSTLTPAHDTQHLVHCLPLPFRTSRLQIGVFSSCSVQKQSHAPSNSRIRHQSSPHHIVPTDPCRLSIPTRRSPSTIIST